MNSNVKLAGILGAGLVMVMALLATIPSNGQERGSAKGGAALLAPRTVAAGTGAVMKCKGCKNEAVTKVDASARGADQQKVLATKHLCGSCTSTVTVAGHGKAKRNVLNHLCPECIAQAKPSAK